MTPEEEAKAQQRRARHREQLRAALPADFNAPRPPSPFGPARAWKWQDSFTPQGLAAAGGEGARFFGDKVFQPMARAGREAFGALSEGVENWNANRLARDRADRALSARYMPMIRGANANAERLMGQERILRGSEDALAADYEKSNAYLAGRAGALSRPFAAEEPNAYPAIEGPGRRLKPPGAPYQAPESMSDEDLMAELAALGQGGGR